MSVNSYAGLSLRPLGERAAMAEAYHTIGRIAREYADKGRSMAEFVDLLDGITTTLGDPEDIRHGSVGGADRRLKRDGGE